MVSVLPAALIVIGGGTMVIGGLLTRSTAVDVAGKPMTVWGAAPFSAATRTTLSAVLTGAIGVAVGLAIWALVGASTIVGLGLTVLLGAVGALIPRARADRAERQRLRAGNAAVASFAGLLSVELRSGLGVDAAIENVANELDGVLSDEVQTATSQVRLGMTRGRALELLRERLPAPNVERLVQALQHAGELGAPVAETLDNLAADCTTRRYQEVREEAAKLPVKLLFPVLFCIFPPMLMVLAGPAMVSIAEALG
jgi:tight adherence protein C